MIPKEYVDINSWYKPTASSPILLEIYTPKETPINCRKIDITVKTSPFKINNFNFLKKILEISEIFRLRAPKGVTCAYIYERI